MIGSAVCVASSEYVGSEYEVSMFCTSLACGDQRLSVDGLIGAASATLLIATGWPRDDAEKPVQSSGNPRSIVSEQQTTIKARGRKLSLWRLTVVCEAGGQLRGERQGHHDSAGERLGTHGGRRMQKKVAKGDGRDGETRMMETRKRTRPRANVKYLRIVYSIESGNQLDSCDFDDFFKVFR